MCCGRAVEPAVQAAAFGAGRGACGTQAACRAGCGAQSLRCRCAGAASPVPLRLRRSAKKGRRCRCAGAASPAQHRRAGAASPAQHRRAGAGRRAVLRRMRVRCGCGSVVKTQLRNLDYLGACAVVSAHAHGRARQGGQGGEGLGARHGRGTVAAPAKAGMVFGIARFFSLNAQKPMACQKPCQLSPLARRADFCHVFYSGLWVSVIGFLGSLAVFTPRAKGLPVA